MSRELDLVMSGQAPTDRMYGLVELRRAGHDVHFDDSRFTASFDTVRRRVRPFANLMNAATLRGIADDDVVVVKDEFSTMLTSSCRANGTPVVYLDALFGFPKRFWRKAATRYNLAKAHGHVVYSREQIGLWSERYGMPQERFTWLPYCIDMAFYRRPVRRTAEPYVLSVGRDLGRDFPTLVTAMQGLGMNLKLVTLPYTLRGIDTSASWIEVLQHVKYEDLFQLYADALMVVIPLRGEVTYPSGIRGLLEALALRAPVICSRTTVLGEYVPEGQGVRYVNPGDPQALRSAIVSLRDDHQDRMALEAAGESCVRTRYDMPVFAASLEQYLRELTGAR